MSDDAATLNRAPVDLQNPPVELARRYVQPTLEMVDLGFAGRYAPDNPVHQTIANLTAGDPLVLRESERHWELTDANGNIVGRMSKEKFTNPLGTQFLSGRVASIIVWRREDSAVEYQNMSRSDSWEVVVPDEARLLYVAMTRATRELLVLESAVERSDARHGAIIHCPGQ